MLQNERKSLCLQIQDFFKEQIVSDKLKEHDKIPTEKELIEQFKVSRITVANAMAGLAKGGWIYRIPGRGSFVSGELENLKQEARAAWKLAASTMVRQSDYVSAHIRDSAVRTRLIGLLIPEIDTFFAMQLIRGVERALWEHDFRLVIMMTRNSKEEEEKVINQLIQMGVEGLLIFPVDAETYNDAILALKFQNFPFVLIDRYLPGVETHYICSDNVLGARLAVSHLWEMGHRKIAICSNTSLPTVTIEHRIQGYMKELKERGTIIDPALMLTDIEFDTAEIKIDKDHPLFRYVRTGYATAYLALHSRLGLMISHIARQNGLHIPEDISVITFDDPATGYEGAGSFTHVAQSEGEMGRKAAEILLESIENNDRKPIAGYQKVILTPQLVLRDSTGPVKESVFFAQNKKI